MDSRRTNGGSHPRAPRGARPTDHSRSKTSQYHYEHRRTQSGGYAPNAAVQAGYPSGPRTGGPQGERTLSQASEFANNYIAQSQSSHSQSHSHSHTPSSDEGRSPAWAHYSLPPPKRRHSSDGVRQSDGNKGGWKSRSGKRDHRRASSEIGFALEDGRPDGWTVEDEAAEREFLQRGLVNWRQMSEWQFWFRAAWWYWYIIFAVILILVVLMTAFHDKIVKWCTPAANWMNNLNGGWAIPIAILFVISFPPLFGHEIVALICGVVWGLWKGFGIVAAGTFLGEMGNFVVFRVWCTARAKTYERRNIQYACLAHVIRHGGMPIAILARLSVIPAHLTTPIFSTCGMAIWVFLFATFITLPKQIIPVYLGVMFGDAGKKTTKDRVISWTVVGGGFLLTVFAAWYIYHRMVKVRQQVWRKQRMYLAAKSVPMQEVSPTAPVMDVPDIDQLPRPREKRFDSENRDSYATPYQIRYNRQEDMSIYAVDAMTERVNLDDNQTVKSSRWRAANNRPQPAPAAMPSLEEGGESEAGHGQPYPQEPQYQYTGQQDEYQYDNQYQQPDYGYAEQGQRYAGFQAGPQAAPAGFPEAHPSGVRREPSATGAYYHHGPSVPTHFPVPVPGRSPYNKV